MVLPLYMQIVHGASPTQGRLLMLPMVLGMMSGSIISGQIISRTGRIRPFPMIGSALICVVALSCCSRPPPTPTAAGDRPLDARARRRAGQLHAAAPADHAERRAAARDRRGDRLGDLLPPDRRHPRRRGLPVRPVQHAWAATSVDEFEKAAQTPAFQQVVRAPEPDRSTGGRRGPRTTAPGGASGAGAVRLVVHRARSRRARASVQAGVRGVDGPRLPDGCRGRADRLRAPAVHAQGRAARHVGGRRGARRGGRRPRPRRWIRRPEPRARVRRPAGPRPRGAWTGRPRPRAGRRPDRDAARR